MRRLRNDDRGASLVFVAVTLVVLIGMVAFAVDAGALYTERRELQNGADAAALAVAENCALGAAPCTSTYGKSTASLYAEANTRDGAAGIDDVTIDQVAQTVSIVTSTVDGASGSTVLAPFFAQVLGFEGTTVRARATAGWGYPASLRATMPIIISECEWEKYGGPPFPGPDATIFFHGSSETCHASPSGQDLPGGFGWLESAGNCDSYVEVNTWVTIDPGASPPYDCDPYDFHVALGDVIYLPFFDDIQMTGNNALYRVAGFGALHVTGFNFGGQFKEPMGALPCTGEDRCISGYFTEGPIYEGEFGGDDHGVVLIKLTN